MERVNRYWMLACCLCAVLLATPVYAAGPDAARQERDDAIARHAARLDGLREQIDANFGAYPDQFEEYLDHALSMVYLAKVSANLDGSSIAATNSDLTQLAELGYLASWPANPLNDWQPMRVLTSSDSFSAGDIVFELCPAAESTTIGGSSVQASFNLYVYGHDAASAARRVVLPGENAAWGKAPAGALFNRSFYLSSDRERDDRKRRQAERKAAQAREGQAAAEVTGK